MPEPIVCQLRQIAKVDKIILVKICSQGSAALEPFFSEYLQLVAIDSAVIIEVEGAGYHNLVCADIDRTRKDSLFAVEIFGQYRRHEICIAGIETRRTRPDMVIAGDKEVVIRIGGRVGIVPISVIYKIGVDTYVAVETGLVGKRRAVITGLVGVKIVADKVRVAGGQFRTDSIVRLIKGNDVINDIRRTVGS